MDNDKQIETGFAERWQVYIDEVGLAQASSEMSDGHMGQPHELFAGLSYTFEVGNGGLSRGRTNGSGNKPLATAYDVKSSTLTRNRLLKTAYPPPHAPKRAHRRK